MAQTLSHEEFQRLYVGKKTINLSKLPFISSQVKKRDGTMKTVERTLPHAVKATYVTKAFASKLADKDGEMMLEKLVGVEFLNSERCQDAKCKELIASARVSGDWQPVGNYIGISARCGSNRTAWSALPTLAIGTEITVTFEKVQTEEGVLIVCEVASVPPPPALASDGVFDFSMVDDTVLETKKPAVKAKAKATA